MNFPPFWAQASQKGFSCWRWSHDSLEVAQDLANQAVRDLVARFGDQYPASPSHRYYGTDRPMREPVLREFRDDAGNLAAVVTRNSYGCLVLNTARMMFVDVDAPEPAPNLESIGQRIMRMFFGRPAPAEPPVPQFEAKILDLARTWEQSHPGWGWRVYRTKAGFRLLATHALFEPDGSDAEAVFNALGADPLYRKLCRAQKCFRARLTPKPWRCGSATLRIPWPQLTARAQQAYEAWEKRYAGDCREWATCELIAKIGNPEVHQGIRPLLVVHDETSQANSKLPLA